MITRSPDQTIELGKKIGRGLSGGDVVALVGELGTGKTVLAKGIAVGAGVEKNCVTSPSFVLIKEYKGKILVYHIDLYRIEKLRGFEIHNKAKCLVAITCV